MLTKATRPQYRHLLDAEVLQESAQTALTFISTEAQPIHYTRADVLRQVQRYALAWHNHGLTAGDLLIIAHPHSLESIFAFWGALWIGAIPSMFPTLTEKLDPQVYRRNMAVLVAHSGVKAIFTNAQFAPFLAELVECQLLTESDVSTAQNDVLAPAQASPEQIAFLQHSSGTTGLQKGVALSHQAVLNQLAHYSDSLSLQPDDVIVSWLPLYHDMGLIAGFLLPFIQGLHLVLMSPFDWVQHPAMLLRAISQYRATLLWLPNFAYHHMARRVRRGDLDGVSLASVRAFVNCSEPVRDESHQLFLERFAPIGVRPQMLTVSYAMAENTFAVTQSAIGQAPYTEQISQDALSQERHARIAHPDEKSISIVSCGTPLDNVQVRILDDKGQTLAMRQVGEVAIKSDCMLTEYYQRPDLQPFHEGWYLTGDMGYMAEGQLFIIGRKKDLIINAGKNVYPQDLEAIVNEIEGVHAGRAVCFGVWDEREGTELIAIVAETHTPDDPDHIRQLSAQIRQRIAQEASVTVSYVHLVGDKWLLKTSSGKIARSANRDKWQNERQSSD